MPIHFNQLVRLFYFVVRKQFGMMTINLILTDVVLSRAQAACKVWLPQQHHGWPEGDVLPLTHIAREGLGHRQYLFLFSQGKHPDQRYFQVCRSPGLVQF